LNDKKLNLTDDYFSIFDQKFISTYKTAQELDQKENIN
jgi:hypothetical protein